MDVMFYVMDEGYGVQVPDETCGCVNEFKTYKQALKVCKKVSKENAGRFTVGVCVPSTVYVDGKAED